MVLEGTQQPCAGWISHAHWPVLEGAVHPHQFCFRERRREVCLLQRQVQFAMLTNHIRDLSGSVLMLWFCTGSLCREPVLGVHRIHSGSRLSQEANRDGERASQRSNRRRALLHADRTDVLLQSKQVSHETSQTSGKHRPASGDVFKLPSYRSSDRPELQKLV